MTRAPVARGRGARHQGVGTLPMRASLGTVARVSGVPAGFGGGGPMIFVVSIVFFANAPQ